MRERSLNRYLTSFKKLIEEKNFAPITRNVFIDLITADLDHNLYDISKIDFDRLRKEFERCRNKNTTIANLKDAIEKRLDRMIQQNPFRTDFQVHYERIISEYNSENDRATIEKKN